MSKATFLPCVDDPSAVTTWLKTYQHWESEAGELKIRFGLPHGKALKEMVLETKADKLLFIEMDGIVLSPSWVSACFDLLGKYDVIGSPRFSCSKEIADVAQNRFNLNYEGEGDKGPAFWPNFFFVRREILLQTDLDFDPYGWRKGETLYGHTFAEDVQGDTMVWMSLQLRELTDKILEIPQYHCSPYDMEHYQSKIGIFAENIPWVHLGSVSGNLTPPNSELERNEITRRIVWKKICGENIDEYIRKFYISMDEVNKQEEIYRNLLRV